MYHTYMYTILNNHNAGKQVYVRMNTLHTVTKFGQNCCGTCKQKFLCDKLMQFDTYIFRRIGISTNIFYLSIQFELRSLYLFYEIPVLQLLKGTVS